MTMSRVSASPALVGIAWGIEPGQWQATSVPIKAGQRQAPMRAITGINGPWKCSLQISGYYTHIHAARKVHLLFQLRLKMQIQL